MNRVELVKIISHQELVANLVGQFVFMILMAKPQDKNFKQIRDFDIKKMFDLADNYFVEFTGFEGMIETDKCDLSNKITDFLSEYSSIFDTKAIQQNIHYQLSVLDQDTQFVLKEFL